MALSGYRRSVTDTAIRLDGGKSTASVLVVNRGSAAVYLGESTVTTANGVQLDAGAAVSIDLGPRDRLYGVAASGSHSVHVLAVTR